ncbi:MAG: hypothetical protein WCD69_12865 [Xanthobacteraceae bacterium]
MEWKPIDTAPFDRNVELAVIDGSGVHALTFPCRRVFGGWVNAQNNKRLYYLLPTHWRDQPASPKSETAPAGGETSVETGAQALTQRLAAIHRFSSRLSNI